jgi:DNA-directed RNA polymerase subunit M/transcription elongation factor TFIIS
MKFCPKCDRAMVLETSSGAVTYHCTVCQEVVVGTEWDARVGGSVLGSGETTEKYKLLIEVSPHDKTNQLVAKDCERCGLDYMTQIRVGDSEVIVHTCKCGAVITGKASFRVSEAKGAAESLHGLSASHGPHSPALGGGSAGKASADAAKQVQDAPKRVEIPPSIAAGPLAPLRA